MVISKIKAVLLGGSQRTRTVKKNALGALVIKLYAMAIQFVQVPIVLSYLTKESYGLYLTITSIVMWAHNFDFGLGSGLRYKLTESIAVGDEKKSRELVSTAYFSLTAIMLMLGIIVIPLCFCLNWDDILNCHDLSPTYIGLCIAIVTVTFLFQFILDLITIILQANQKTAISTAFRPIANTIAVLGVISLREFSFNSLLYACLILTLPLVLILLIANVILFIGKFKNIRPSLSYYSKDKLRDIYSLGTKFFLSSLSGLVVFNTSNILLSNLINPAEVSVYSTAYTYFSIIIVFHGIILTPFWPAITNAFVQDEFNWLKTCMSKLARLTLLFSFGAIVLLAISKFAFHIWIGDLLYIPTMLSVSLCLFAIGNVWSAMYNCFIVGVGKAQLTMYLSIIKIIIFIPVAIYLIRLFGVIGLVSALIVINTLPNIVIAYMQYVKIVNQKASGIWNK